MLHFQPDDVLKWIKSNMEWRPSFEYLSQSKHWSQLYFGSKGSVGSKLPVATYFKTQEDIVSYFVKHIPSDSVANAEIAAKWIIYNLLQLKIANEFLLAAKDVKMFAIDDVFNVGELGPKYQTGWCSFNNKGCLNISFVFWGRGDGSRAGKNQNRLQCLATFLYPEEFYSAHAKTITDCAQLLVKAHFTLQRNADKGWQRTKYTTWKDILNDARDLNGIQP